MENPKCDHKSMIFLQTYHRRKLRCLACDDLPIKKPSTACEGRSGLDWQLWTYCG